MINSKYDDGARQHVDPAIEEATLIARSTTSPVSILISTLSYATLSTAPKGKIKGKVIVKDGKHMAGETRLWSYQSFRQTPPTRRRLNRHRLAALRSFGVSTEVL